MNGNTTRQTMLLGLLTIALSGAAFTGMAQTEKSAEPAPQQTEDKSKAETPEANKKAPPTQQSSENFIPTEEISEDLSVSFPVDI